MKRVKSIRRKASARRPKKAPSLSTSDARRNFAASIEAAQARFAILGFERYGTPVAALVPVEAVRMLAGQRVSKAAAETIKQAAAQFVANLDAEAAAGEPSRKRAAKKKRKAVGKSV